jgi:cytochrome P450
MPNAGEVSSTKGTHGMNQPSVVHDPLDADGLHESWARLGAATPVHYLEHYGHWIVASAEHVEQVLRDPVTFSSAAARQVAGSRHSTGNLIASSIAFLLQQPAELAVIRRDPERLPLFIEEMLRFQAPVNGLFRTATRDVDPGRRRIRAGDRVQVPFGSACRDEERFSCPGEFDREREKARSHLAFGTGIHLCASVRPWLVSKAGSRSRSCSSGFLTCTWLRTSPGLPIGRTTTSASSTRFTWAGIRVPRFADRRRRLEREAPGRTRVRIRKI